MIEIGVGQWGSVLSFVCQYFGIECEVYMVKISYEQKFYCKMMMNIWGVKVYFLFIDFIEVGCQVLAKNFNLLGSFGIVILEVVECVVFDEYIKYVLGSVFNYVFMY